MKKIITIILSILVFNTVYSQGDNDSIIIEDIEKPLSIKKVLIVTEYTADTWQDAPEGLEVSDFNPGFNAYVLRNRQISNSPFSFAFGIGIGVHNLHSDGIPDKEIDTATLLPTGNTVFNAIPEDVNGKQIEFKTNKFTLAYLDIPIQIRFISASGFNFFIGGKAGFMMSNHTKYKGDNLDGADYEIKMKMHNIDNVMQFRYGVGGGLGYKWINLSAFYQLSNIFEDGKGPEMAPLSVGFSIFPF